MKEALFGVVVAAILLNCATTAFSIARPDRRIWPPPGRNSWQYVYDGIVAYTGLIGPVAIGLLDWNSFVFDHGARFVVGGLLVACGLFALWGYLALGDLASRGLGGQLVSEGPYRYSRNPQYVGTIPAVLGFAVICNSGLGLAAALLSCAWYVLVPFAEESWCREKLGAEYEEYAARTPRFFGLP